MQNQTSLAIPIAIVLGFGMIAVAIYFAGNDKTPAGGSSAGRDNVTDTARAEPIPIAIPAETDKIRGNPNAEIMIVEYSDYDCPFCKLFHNTMNSLMSSSLGVDGTVAWTYRHFPISSLHPNAPTIAHVAECLKEDSGNDSFWGFTDDYYENQGKVTEVGSLATDYGISTSTLNLCMEEERHLDTIKADIEEVVKAGGGGTPYSVFVFKEEMGEELKGLIEQLKARTERPGAPPTYTIISEHQLGMSGAQTEATIKQIIQAYLGINEDITL